MASSPGRRARRWAGRTALRLAALVVVGTAPLAGAQQQPIDPPLELPDFRAEALPRGNVLPPLVDPAPERLEGGARVFLQGYRITGSTVFGQQELAQIAAPYSGRFVSFEDIAALRDQLSEEYAKRGYVTSGAVLESQRIEDGQVEIRLVEGTLARVDIETDGRLREGYLRRGLPDPGEGPVNVVELEQRLQILRQDPRIRSIEAVLEPGPRRSESALRLKVVEAPAFHTQVETNNGVSPSIGGELTRLSASHSNLTGWGDSLSVSFGRSHGLREKGASYEIPLGPFGTRFEAELRQSSSRVIEFPFSSLRIRSSSSTYALGLRQPFDFSPGTQLDLSLRAEVRRSRSFLAGRPFGFGQGVREDGVSKVTALRFSQELTRATQSQVFAARSTLSFGIDAGDATRRSDRGIPDSRFRAWLAQLQYARRFDALDAQLIARADAQLSDDPLLGLEQFAIGGLGSVRGFRQNELVRDNGGIASLELRVPIFQRSEGVTRVELAPFLDVGTAFNRRRDHDRRALASAGVGLRVRFAGRFLLEAYWAEDVCDNLADGFCRLDTNSRGDDVQDDGIHFRVSAGL
jgi:hemolysin activation/secretion protein